MPSLPKTAKATLESLERVFTVPEAPDSTLGRLERRISENLLGFLREQVVAQERELSDLELSFSSSEVPEEPTFVSDQARFLLNNVVSQSVHTASPYFVGHMTSALPYFMLPLSKIMIALNQNLVKTETSKAFTPLERQVIGMLHRLVFAKTPEFYAQCMHSSEQPLGMFCSGGTVANITALWVARNRAFRAEADFPGVNQAGVFRALRHYGYEGVAVLVSERGHYSLKKAMDLLGMGRESLITVPTDEQNKIDVSSLRTRCKELRAEKVKIIAIVGIAGTTETGNVDPLNEIADVCEEYECHFHVDAAWAGPVLMSETHRRLMEGIERADTVTLDAHKQLYVPMGAGMVLLREPAVAKEILHFAHYIVRPGSKDLGVATLEGSRPGMAMLVHSALRIFGRQGFELLIDRGIKRAAAFARMIEQDKNFQLISAPETNILTYRLVPPQLHDVWSSLSDGDKAHINLPLNALTVELQKTQRERGHSFVSRTTLTPAKNAYLETVVFRSVLANPLTTESILGEVLAEQVALAQLPALKTWMERARTAVSDCA